MGDEKFQFALNTNWQKFHGSYKVLQGFDASISMNFLRVSHCNMPINGSDSVTFLLGSKEDFDNLKKFIERAQQFIKEAEALAEQVNVIALEDK
jgi:hypothetical protein